MNADKYIIILGIMAGIIIGFFTAILDAAGGELIIPVSILLFGIDTKRMQSFSCNQSANNDNRAYYIHKR